MQEHTSNPLEELAREPVTSQELRALLERLGSQEFGGPEEPDVRAVSEATGVPVEAIGRILADIRRKELHDRYGRDIERHEQDIRRLELTTDQIARRGPAVTGFDPEVVREIEAVARERIRERSTSAVGVMLLAALIAVAIALAAGSSVGRAHPQRARSAASVKMSSGAEVYVDSNGNEWVIDRNGTQRAPRGDDEESAVLTLRKSLGEPWPSK